MCTCVFVCSTECTEPVSTPVDVPVVSQGQPATAVTTGAQQPLSTKTNRVTSVPKPCGIDPLLILQERENR